MNKEAVGSIYNLKDMHYARNMTWQAVDQIAALIQPGMRESAARETGMTVLKNLGMERIWHPLLIRFGENTLNTFQEYSKNDPVLLETDIFFVDIGAVWKGHEGDCGDTFVVGDDPEMKACIAAAKAVFESVHAKWQNDSISGAELYRYAEQEAERLGWRLNSGVKGHRVSDFPHAIYKAGELGDYEQCPDTGLWILEIQLAHPTRRFGAFYEDLIF